MLSFLAVLIVLQLAVWWFYYSASNTFGLRPMSPNTTLYVNNDTTLYNYVNKTYELYVLEHLDTVLLGGMSFIGSRLAVYLNGKVRNIRVMEDVINVDPDPLKWYRWGELNKLGIAQSIYDSDITNLSCNSSFILYIPTMYNGKINKDNLMWKPLHFYNQLKNMLIGLLNDKCTCDWIIILVYNRFNLQMAWINLLERLLMNIVWNVDLNEDTTISVIKIGQVYGPWQDNLDTIPVNSSLYMDELGMIVMQILTKPESKIFNYIYMTPHAGEAIGNTGVVETRKWLVEYKKLCEMPKKDIVTAAALKIQGSYAAFYYNDHVTYIKPWYRSAMYFNLNALLIHNTIPESIQTRLKSVYKHIEFLKVKAEDYHRKFATDARFYILYDYLLTRPEIHFVITTDVKDVKFLNDPFKVIAGIGTQYLYIGYDHENFLKELESSFDIDQLEHCYPNYKYANETLQLAGYFNCGTMGGSRELMLTMLSHMMLLFDTTKHNVCDMVTVSIIAHLYMYDLVFTLYPFNNGFRNHAPGPHGLAIKHHVD